ncbi:hypothetical protein ABZ299_25480 [Streptomyces sp. NPDC006184]|uniref:hypothetical protein n=1 Tax=Streptomyces sp. NPDC006184 TaxID=3155455 RepID=UPI0033ADC7F8
MTDRRPLGAGPCPADTELPGAPRARLAAERLEAGAAPAAAPARPTGRRVLGTGAGQAVTAVTDAVTPGL